MINTSSCLVKNHNLSGRGDQMLLSISLLFQAASHRNYAIALESYIFNYSISRYSVVLDSIVF
jgi:hypothetical protein